MFLSPLIVFLLESNVNYFILGGITSQVHSLEPTLMLFLLKSEDFFPQRRRGAEGRFLENGITVL